MELQELWDVELLLNPPVLRQIARFAARFGAR